MIAFYEKQCLEAPIKNIHGPALVDAANSLKEKYNGLVCSTLAMLPGRAANLEVRKHQLDLWLKERPKANLVLEVFAPEEAQNLCIFVQLRDIGHLSTDFGKQHHRDCVAYMAVHTFSEHPLPEETIATFNDDLREAVKTSLDLKETPPITGIATANKVFTSLEKKATQRKEPVGLTLAALDKLLDSKLRGIIIRARQAKEPTTSNIAKSIGLDESLVRPVLETASKEGILTKEYNVLCDRCAKAVARVPSKKVILRMTKDKVSCSSCGTPIRPTSYEEVYIVPTEICELLDGSRWMSLCAERSLRALGVEGRRILLEVIDGPNELDVVANFDGDLLLMELTDNRFSIGHAYPFVGKCSLYKPEIPIVVSTEGIDPDVKEYIENTGFNAHYVDDINKLDDQLKQIFSEVYGIRLTQLLQQVGWDSFLSPSLLERFGVARAMPGEASAYDREMMIWRGFFRPPE